MIGARANAHSAEIDAMPGSRAFQEAEMAAEAARYTESARIYDETLEELMSGDGEISYPLEIIDGDTDEGGLWHQRMDAYEMLCKATTDAERLLAFHKFYEIYKKGCERYAERKAEDV